MANIALPKNYKLLDYKIERKISSGGFSIVYLGYTKEGAPVAIKEYFPSTLHLRSKGQQISFNNLRDKSKFNSGLKAFREEMEIVSKLKHKNIIEITNYFECNGTAYIVMPYEYGMGLNRYIGQRDFIEEQDIINIIIGVFSAISLLHKNNIVHLDLKPGNIWLRPNKEALILDFGTARIINDEEEMKKNPPMFTPGYAAPEQHRQFFSPEKIGYWTDLYGLGTTLYSLLQRKSLTPADKLIAKNQTVEIVKERYGIYNKELLEIVEDLTQLDIKDRKKLNLDKIIEKIQSIKVKNINLNIMDNLKFE